LSRENRRRFPGDFGRKGAPLLDPRPARAKPHLK
jgi:hypothetical protein